MGDTVVHRDHSHSEPGAFPHHRDRGQCLSVPAHSVCGRKLGEDECDVKEEGSGRLRRTIDVSTAAENTSEHF